MSLDFTNYSDAQLGNYSSEELQALTEQCQQIHDACVHVVLKMRQQKSAHYRVGLASKKHDNIERATFVTQHLPRATVAAINLAVERYHDHRSRRLHTYYHTCTGEVHLIYNQMYQYGNWMPDRLTLLDFLDMHYRLTPYNIHQI